MAFFENFCFGACLFFLGYNLESRKFMMLFDLKWVSRQDSIGCSSFFGQILSFRPPRWQFFENFHFDARFCFSQNLDLYKFLQLFDWKWVNGQDSIGCSSFFGQIPLFRPRGIFFLKIFISVLFFFFASKFRFGQIFEAFQLEMGQRPRLHRRFIVFQQNSIV